MHDVVSRFSILFPANLITKKGNIIVKEAKLLQAKYSDDISPEFPLQLLSFRTILENEIKKSTTVKQFANLLILDYDAISSTYFDICTARIIFLTLPVSMASAERSFSKLNYIFAIKWLKCVSKDQRKAALNIEAERAKVMDTDKLTERFAEMKARRKKLI